MSHLLNAQQHAAAGVTGQSFELAVSVGSLMQEMNRFERNHGAHVKRRRAARQQVDVLSQRFTDRWAALGTLGDLDLPPIAGRV